MKKIELSNSKSFFRVRERHGFLRCQFDNKFGKGFFYVKDSHFDKLASYKTPLAAYVYASKHKTDYAPTSITCDKQVGGNPPQAPSSSQSKARGNLLSLKFNKARLHCFRAKGSVCAVLYHMGQKFIYHLTLDGYYLFRRMNQDSIDLYNRSLGIKRCIAFLKKNAIKADNANLV